MVVVQVCVKQLTQVAYLVGLKLSILPGHLLCHKQERKQVTIQEDMDQKDQLFKKKVLIQFLIAPQVTSSLLHSINVVLCIFLAFFSFPRSMTIFLNTGQLSNILTLNLTDPGRNKILRTPLLSIARYLSRVFIFICQQIALASYSILSVQRFVLLLKSKCRKQNLYFPNDWGFLGGGFCSSEY